MNNTINEKLLLNIQKRVQEHLPENPHSLDSELRTIIQATHENNAALHFDNDIQQIGAAQYIICKIVITDQQNSITSKGFAEIVSGNVAQANQSAKKEAINNLFPLMELQQQTPLAENTKPHKPGEKEKQPESPLPALTKENPDWDKIVAKAKEIGNAKKVFEFLSKCFAIEPAVLSQVLSEAGLS